MKNIAAYIISFLPDDERRDIRLETINKQLTEWLENSTMNIYILAMNYTDADVLSLPKDKRIHAIQHGGLTTTFAHVAIQEVFYASNYKWGICLDDDACLYNGPQHNSSYNMFAEMDTHIDDYVGIGAFYPLNPMTVGFNAFYAKEPRYADHHIFIRLMTPKSTLYGLRNFRLYGEEPIYNDTDFNHFEDLAFNMNLKMAGHMTYTCPNLILKELNHNASFFGGPDNKDTSHRTKAAIVVRDQLIAKYPTLLSAREGKANPNMRLFDARYVTGPKELYIPKNGAKEDDLFKW